MAELRASIDAAIEAGDEDDEIEPLEPLEEDEEPDEDMLAERAQQQAALDRRAAWQAAQEKATDMQNKATELAERLESLVDDAYMKPLNAFIGWPIAQQVI